MAAPRIRITVLYDKTLSAGPQTDVLVTQTDDTVVHIPAGTSKSMLVSLGIKSVAADTIASAQTPSSPQDIG